jgi:glycosyltransferase involved in cell wall biosynthesis
VNYKQACIKRNIELLLLSPFIVIGKCLGYLIAPPIKTSIFLFFPSADIGGSPKVNATILQLLKAQSPLVIFSKYPNNNGFKDLFYSADTKILDLHRLIDNKYYHFINVIYRGIISTWINRSENPIVLGGECIYFYKVVPHLNKKVKTIELSHLNTWLNYNQAFIKYIDYRVTSTPNLVRNFEQQYRENKVPLKYLSRLSYIDNWVDIPPCKTKKDGLFNVLFVGRGAPQKRVPIISAIAEDIMKEQRDITFSFVGDVSHLLSAYVLEHAQCYEFVKEMETLYEIYDQADVLILTSAFEGLPIVIMDMMARGKVVISTAVDGIPDYIIHMQTGLLIEELEDEQKIKEQGKAYIYKLYHNKELCIQIGQKARAAALAKFDRSVFEEKYLQLFTR